MTTPTPAVEARSLVRRYGDATALDDVTFALEPDRIVGLLGRNGAGKSTLMQLLTAQDFPSSGAVRIFGEDPTENQSLLSRTCFVKERQRYPDAFRVGHVLRAATLAAITPAGVGALAIVLAALLAGVSWLMLRRAPAR